MAYLRKYSFLLLCGIMAWGALFLSAAAVFSADAAVIRTADVFLPVAASDSEIAGVAAEFTASQSVSDLAFTGPEISVSLVKADNSGGKRKSELFRRIAAQESGFAQKSAASNTGASDADTEQNAGKQIEELTVGVAAPASPPYSAPQSVSDFAFARPDILVSLIKADNSGEKGKSELFHRVAARENGFTQKSAAPNAGASDADTEQNAGKQNEELKVGVAAPAPPASPPYSAPQPVSDLAAALIDAVVNISTSQMIKGAEEGDNLSLLPPAAAPESSPFQEYFQDFFSDKDGKGTARKTQSLGSGFIIDAERGLVVTNNHVIADADDIEVNFSDGSKLKAKLLGKDGKTDIALLQIDAKAKKLHAVSFGNSTHARIGDWVMAIGNPFGFGGSVTLGIISARNRNINSGPYDDFIQTDAAINRGNSGGPLFDMEGKVIGINTAIISPSGGSIGIGFAIPSELAMGVVRQLQEFGETRRGWLAVRIQPVTADIAASFGRREAEGAVVSGHIESAKDVDNKELHDGDIILRFGNKVIKNARLLPRMVAETPVGADVPVEIWRNGKSQIVTVRLGLLDEKSDDSSAAANDDEPPAAESKPKKKDKEKEKPKSAAAGFILGMQLAELTDDIRSQYSIVKEVEGVAVLAVIPGSNAAEKRIAAGNVIIDVNQEAVKTAADVEKKLSKLKDLGRKNALLMLAAPSGELRFVTVLLE